MVKENTAEPLTDQHFTELFRHINVTETVPTQTEDLATSLQSRFLKVNDEVLIAGQIDESTLPQIKECGIKTVFNLRDGGEDGCVDLEPQLAAKGIKYVHLPVEYDGDNWCDAHVDKVLAAIDGAETPVLAYCRSGARAAALSVAHDATRSRFHNGRLPSAEADAHLTSAQDTLLQRVCADQGDDSMARFVQAYVERKVKLHLSRPGTTALAPDVFLAGQLAEEELREMQARGVKSVLNFRQMDEVGQFGLGMLAKEKELVEKLGMRYEHIPVPKNGPYADKPELLAAIQAAYASLERPLLIHCRTGRRARDVLVDAHVISE